jgi:hypothetical protein
VVISCAFTPYNNVLLQNSPLAGGHFPLVPFIIVLVLVTLINPVLSIFGERYRFHYHEILLIWSMVAVATGFAYTGLFRTFIINITTPAWFTTAATQLDEILLPLLPSSLFPKETELIQTLYRGLEGGRDMGWWQVLTQIPWQSWIIPMLWWGLFIIMVYTALLGMMGLFTHQWIENEKMNFPLLRVLQVVGQEAEKKTLWKYFSHKYFIVGLSIPLMLHLFNGLNTYFPQVPHLPTLFLAQPYMPKEGLLSGFYKLKIYIYPAFIGFAFLTSKQVSFSLWFLFLLGGLLPGLLQSVGWRFPAAALGTTFGPVLSRVEEMQMVGAFGIFFLFIIWLARNHLKIVLRSVFLKKSRVPVEDFHGLLSPQWALFLFLGGFIGITAWLSFFGMSLISALAFLAISFMLQLVTARLICQGGLPYFTLTAAPSDGFLAFLDSRVIGPISLYLGLAVQKITFLDMRESLTPSLFHTSRLSDGSHPRTRFVGGIVCALGLGLVISFVAMLALYYKFGIASLPDDWAVETARRVHENVGQLIQYPEEAKRWSITFTLIGAVVMILLIAGFHSFIWWPLHPIGYLTTYSSAMRILWFSFFVGWFCNTLVLRYGGINPFKEVRRLFIGLVVGDMVMAMVWLIVGLFSPFTYHVLPL